LSVHPLSPINDIVTKTKKFREGGRALPELCPEILELDFHGEP
jgi:hypothetical protein